MIYRPALRYYGGKWLLAKKIISLFPSHLVYVEPYGGAASVLIQKTPSDIEIYNDLDQAVFTFFKVLTEQTDDLIRQILLTPWARIEYADSLRTKTDDPLELARQVYVNLWQGIGAERGRHSGWSCFKSHEYNYRPDTWHKPENLRKIAQRLRNVRFCNAPAHEIIEKYDHPNTLFYIDPPYLPATRYQSASYQHEMGLPDHKALLHLLLSVDGKVILSGYQNDLYKDMLADWLRIDFENSQTSNKKNPKVESLWLSPNIGLQQMKLI